MKAYHLTKIKNLYGEDGICSKGLIPMNGERSQSIKDNRCVLSFSSVYYSLPIWYSYLYRYVNPNELCVLSFNIDKKDCTNHINKTEFYTYKTISPKKINIVTFYDEKTLEEIPFYLLDKDMIKYYNHDIFPSRVKVIISEKPINNLHYNKHSLLYKKRIINTNL